MCPHGPAQALPASGRTRGDQHEQMAWGAGRPGPGTGSEPCPMSSAAPGEPGRPSSSLGLCAPCSQTPQPSPPTAPQALTQPKKWPHTWSPDLAGPMSPVPGPTFRKLEPWVFQGFMEKGKSEPKKCGRPSQPQKAHSIPGASHIPNLAPKGPSVQRFQGRVNSLWAGRFSAHPVPSAPL